MTALTPNHNLDTDRPDTHGKALRVNIDKRRYGTFAEIGAGQEVVRWFFQVGGAAGTIAKSMSAYDMTVSDAIYGRANRYVSRQRLGASISDIRILPPNRARTGPIFNCTRACVSVSEIWLTSSQPGMQRERIVGSLSAAHTRWRGA